MWWHGNMKDDIYTEFNMLENEVFDWVLKKKVSWKAGQNWPKNNLKNSGIYIGPLGFIPKHL